jgi:hypothetical protein
MSRGRLGGGGSCRPEGMTSRMPEWSRHNASSGRYALSTLSVDQLENQWKLP